MPRRSRIKTRRASARHHMPTTETDMPIFTRAYIADAVTQARAIDARDGTNLAIQRVADMTHLTPETVARIAAEEAHAEALAGKCGRDCSACACGKAAAGIEAEAVPY